MNDELERTWKEAIVARLRYFPRMCLRGLRKSTKDLSRIADVLTKILTEHHPITDVEG
jgi:hypothetical protein